MSKIKISFLGPLTVEVQGELVAGLSSAKIRALLAYLVVERQPHARGALGELLWPDRPDGYAVQNLRQSLSRLKRALQKAGAPDCIIATRKTLAFNPEVDAWLDVDVFNEALDAVSTHAHRKLERCSACMVRLLEAAAIYRGDFLGDLLSNSPPFEEWATFQRERLHGRLLEVLSYLSAHHIWLEDYQSAYGYAQRQVAMEPWLEGGQRQMMRALVGMGRRTEALRVFEAFRHTLADGLGVAPSTETTELYEAIKHEEIMTPPAAGLMDAESLAPLPVHNLPRQLTPFVGRDKELKELHKRLDRETCALLTILGPGGIGKTRLAIEVARGRLQRHQDGVWFVPLATVNDAALLPSTIATHLNLPLSGTGDPATQLADHLHAKDMLLVLDNVEQLNDNLDLVLDLLKVAHDVQILVTSRTALNFQVEWLYEVSGLAYPEGAETDGSLPAPELFVKVAQRRNQTFDPVTEWAAIIRICQLVEGMPLALELAGARVPRADCSQIATDIARNLDTLATEMRDVPLRQRSLRAAFTFSWDLLGTEDQKMLPRLSRFSGSFSSEAARAVASAGAGDLERLMDSSFLWQVENGRYQMHEVLRQYADEMLGEERTAVFTRHADYYAQFTDSHHKLLNGAEQKAALVSMSRDFANVMTAWQHALETKDTLLLGRFTDGLWAYLDDSGLYQDGLVLFERALASAPQSDIEKDLVEDLLRIWAYLRMAAGFFHQRLGQYLQARQYYKQSLVTYRQLGDLFQRVHCLYYLGGIASNAGRLEDALISLQECLGIYQQLESERHIANTLTKMGSVLELMGRYDEAEGMLRQALALKREANQPVATANSLNNLALLLWRTGRYDEAEALFQEALAIHREIDNPGNIASSLSNLGRLLITLGDYPQAQTLLEESLVLEKTVQNKRHTMIALNNLALVSHLLGESAQVEPYLTQSLALARETGNQREEAYTRLTQGRILLDLGDEDEASRALRRTLQLAMQLRLVPLALSAFVQVARLLANRGDISGAAEVLKRPMQHTASWQQTRMEAQSLAERLGIGRQLTAATVKGDLQEMIVDLIDTGSI